MANNKLLLYAGIGVAAYMAYRMYQKSQATHTAPALPQGTVPSTLTNPTNIPQSGTIAPPAPTLPAHLQSWISRYLSGYPGLTTNMDNALSQLSQADINMFDQVTTVFDNGGTPTAAQNSWWDNFVTTYGLK